MASARGGAGQEGDSPVGQQTGAVLQDPAAVCLHAWDEHIAVEAVGALQLDLHQTLNQKRNRVARLRHHQPDRECLYPKEEEEDTHARARTERERGRGGSQCVYPTGASFGVVGGPVIFDEGVS